MCARKVILSCVYIKSRISGLHSHSVLVVIFEFLIWSKAIVPDPTGPLSADIPPPAIGRQISKSCRHAKKQNATIKTWTWRCTVG